MTLQVNGEPVTITNFRPNLPDPAPAKDRVAFSRAGSAFGLSLGDDGLHGAARALTQPAIAAQAVRAELLTHEVIGPAMLTIFQSPVYLTELLPLIQPRAGAAPRDVDPPKVTGCVTGDGAPEAMIVIRFKDEAHLAAQLRQTVRQTRAMGRDYAASILTKRVSRPILTHVARIEFDDGSDPFVVTVVRDGITRVVSSWATIYPDVQVDDLGDLMVDALLASKRSRRTEESATAVRARGRDVIQQELRARFVQGTAGNRPTEEAIRIGQALTLPAQMIVSLSNVGAPGVPAGQQFDDAVQALVASVHGEFQPWDQSASDAAAILRALPRAVHDDALDEEVAHIATGYSPLEKMPEAFGETTPVTPLWRAVYLVAWLCNPAEFSGIKKHLRDLLGVSQIRRNAYISHLMTLIDLPWRNTKHHTQQQARRAWNNGGPIPHDLVDTTWDPVPTTDFTTLVPKALTGDDNARNTLRVAGGIALVTDKLLMSNTGSALASDEVPFRADVNDIVADLGRNDNEAGLWLLARAANAFRADQKAINSFTPKELLRNPGFRANTYVVPRIDPVDSTALAIDNTGQPERLTTYEVVHVSNPERSAEEREKRKPTAKPRAGKETDTAKAVRLRGNINTAIHTALNDIKALRGLANINGAVNPVLGDHAAWTALSSAVQEIQGLVFMSKPPERSPFCIEPDGLEDEETDANEEQA